jgi:uncharacterized membrane protein
LEFNKTESQHVNSNQESSALATDRKVVQFLLRFGLGLSVLMMLTGLVISLSSGETTATPVEMKSLFGAGLTFGNRLMGTGVLLLALTPVLRVLMLIYLWYREKDWKFAIIALIVFATLMVSISLGGG